MKCAEFLLRLYTEDTPENPVKSGAEGERRYAAQSLRQKNGEILHPYIYYCYIVLMYEF